MMSFHRPRRFDIFIYHFQDWGRLWTLLSTLESSDSDRNCHLTIGTINVEIIMQRIRRTGNMLGYCEYRQSLGLETATRIQPQTDRVLAGLDNAAAC